MSEKVKNLHKSHGIEYLLFNIIIWSMYLGPKVFVRTSSHKNSQIVDITNSVVCEKFENHWYNLFDFFLELKRATWNLISKPDKDTGRLCQKTTDLQVLQFYTYSLKEIHKISHCALVYVLVVCSFDIMCIQILGPVS